MIKKLMVSFYFIITWSAILIVLVFKLKVTITFNGTPNFCAMMYFCSVFYVIIHFSSSLFLDFITFIIVILFYIIIWILIKFLIVLLLIRNLFNFLNPYLLLISYLKYYLTFLLISILFILSFLFLKFNLNFFIIQELFSLYIFISVVYFIKNFSINNYNFYFLFNFIIIEGLCFLFFLISFSVNYLNFFVVFIILKLGIYPFFYYRYLFLNGCVNYLLFRLSITFYFIMSKLIIIIMFFSYPYSINIIAYILLIFCFFIYILLTFNNIVVFDFIINSFFLSNLSFIFLIFTGQFYLVFGYLFYTSYFQFKNLLILKNKNISDLANPYLMLFFLNGMPIFFINIYKILNIFFIKQYIFIIFFLFVIINCIFLVKSLNFIVIFFRKYSYFLIKSMRKIYVNLYLIITIIFILFLFFILFINCFLNCLFFDFILDQSLDTFSSKNKTEEMREIEEKNNKYIEEMQKKKEEKWSTFLMTTPFISDWLGRKVGIVTFYDKIYWTNWHPGILWYGFGIRERQLPKVKNYLRLFIVSYDKKPFEVVNCTERWYRLWAGGVLDKHVRFTDQGKPLPSCFDRNYNKKKSFLYLCFWRPVYGVINIVKRFINWVCWPWS